MEPIGANMFQVSKGQKAICLNGGSVIMRTGILMILAPLALLAIFSILSINVHSIDSTGEESADQLIDSSNGIVQPLIDTRFASNPQASRTVWGMDKGANSAVSSSLPGSDTNPQDSRAKVGTTVTDLDQAENAQNTTETLSDQTSSTPSATAASGSWSFELKDSTLKEAVLTLFQSGDAVFGTGSMNNGNDTLVATASGYIDSDQLYLDITTLGSINLYSLSLTTSGDSVSGDYTAFSADGRSWTGSAEGTRSAPQR